MDQYFKSKDLDSPWWQNKREELLKGIDKAIEREKVDRNILVTIRELVTKAKVRVSMEEYFKEENKEV